MAHVIFIDGNDLRAAEIRKIAPGLDLVVEPLTTGFATAAPEPENKARDKVLAHAASSASSTSASQSSSSPLHSSGAPGRTAWSVSSQSSASCDHPSP